MYVPPSDATNTGCTVHDALYAIGYPGPVFNHLGLSVILNIKTLPETTEKTSAPLRPCQNLSNGNIKA